MAIKLYTKEEYAAMQSVAKQTQTIPTAQPKKTGDASYAPIKLYTKEEYAAKQRYDAARNNYETDYAKISALTRLAERQQEKAKPPVEEGASTALPSSVKQGMRNALLSGAKEEKATAQQYRTQMNWLVNGEAAQHAQAEKKSAQYSSAADNLKRAMQKAAWEKDAKAKSDKAAELMLRAPSIPAGKNIDGYKNTDLLYARFGGLLKTREDDAMRSMTDAERRTLAAYDTNGQHDKAQEYYNAMLPEWRRRAAKYDYAQTKQRAADNKAVGALENILGAPAQTGAYLATAGQAVKNAITGQDMPVDPNSPWMKGAWRQQATSEGVTEGMSGAGKFLTQTGLSIGQYATKLPFGQFALLAMGLEAAGAKSYDVVKRGGSADEALLTGTAAGAIEAITEKLPLDNLRLLGKSGADTTRSALKGILKQAGMEATEEMISELTNNVVDLSVMGERSEVQRFAEQLVSDGMSRAQAENKAFALFFLQNTAMAGLGGALSGGVMAGGGTMVGNYRNAVNIQDGKFADIVQQEQARQQKQQQEAARELQAEQDKRRQLDLYMDLFKEGENGGWVPDTVQKPTAEKPTIDPRLDFLNSARPQELAQTQNEDEQTRIFKAVLEQGSKNKKAAEGSAAMRSFPTQEQGSVVQQLKNAVPQLEKAIPVASVQGNEIMRDGVKAVDAVMDFVKRIGDKVVRPGFGEVLFSKSKIKSSMLGHGVGGTKIETFAAVPEVIKHGKQIGYEQNWKDKKYDTYLFAAPIEYRGEKGYLGVVVAKDNESNRYYVHEVVDQNGNIIYKTKESAGEPSDRRSGLAADLDTVASPADSKNSIAQNIPFVNEGAADTVRRIPTATGMQQKQKQREFLDWIAKRGEAASQQADTMQEERTGGATAVLEQTAQSAKSNAKTEKARELRALYPRIKQAERELAKVKRLYDLSPQETAIARNIVNGLQSFESLDKMDRAETEGIRETALAMQDVEEARRGIREFNAQRKEAMQEKARSLIENAYQWKDKSKGFWYQRETLKRNFRDITGSEAEAQALIDYYWTPVRQNEANNNRMKTGITDKLKSLQIGTADKYRVSYFDDATNGAVNKKVSESALVQLLGEKKITPEQITAAGADAAKIQSAVDTFRQVYDALFEKANDTLVLNGYTPIDKLADYFPHFEDGKPDGLLAKAAAALGIKIDENALPTDIAGITHTFRPGKQWVANFMHREGKGTEFDALQGMDRYLNGVGNVIWHTEDIQKLRVLENELRYKFSDAATQAEVDEIKNQYGLSEWQKESAIAKLYEDRAELSGLGNFVTNLRSYTDSLAGKKQIGDRTTEHAMGRAFYDTVKKLEGRVAANMVAINPGSWLTNFIPLVQGGAQLKPQNMLRAAQDVVRSVAQDDGFRARSTFLTNRMGAEMLDMTNTQKVVDTLAKPMYWIDMFTAETLTRARYAENLQNGMSEEAAMQEADEWVADVMVDRSKGALPTLFEAKSPIVKLFTMFQVEVNNQYSYMFKDIPRANREEGLGRIAWILAKMFIGSYLYNALYRQFTGRDAAFDPIRMVEDTIKRFADPNVKTSDALIGTTTDIAQEIPLVGGWLGGGRLPIVSAIPDLKKTATIFDEDVAKSRKMQVADDELLSTLGAYFALPAGGGQIKKTVQGVTDFVRGGNYAVNKDGEVFLKFPVAQTPANAVRGALFGRYAVPEAQEYIDSGFKAFTPKQTEVIKGAKEEGISQEKAIATLKAVMDAQREAGKSSNTIKRDAIYKSDLTPEQKTVIDHLLIEGKRAANYESYEMMQATSIADDTQRAKAVTAVKAGLKYDDYERHMETLRKQTSDMRGGKAVPGSQKKKQMAYINSRSFTWEQKVALAKALGYDASDVWEAMIPRPRK